MWTNTCGISENDAVELSAVRKKPQNNNTVPVRSVIACEKHIIIGIVVVSCFRRFFYFRKIIHHYNQTALQYDGVSDRHCLRIIWRTEEIVSNCHVIRIVFWFLVFLNPNKHDYGSDCDVDFCPNLWVVCDKHEKNEAIRNLLTSLFLYRISSDRSKYPES